MQFVLRKWGDAAPSCFVADAHIREEDAINGIVHDHGCSAHDECGFSAGCSASTPRLGNAASSGLCTGLTMHTLASTSCCLRRLTAKYDTDPSRLTILRRSTVPNAPSACHLFAYATCRQRCTTQEPRGSCKQLRMAQQMCNGGTMTMCACRRVKREQLTKFGHGMDQAAVMPAVRMPPDRCTTRPAKRLGRPHSKSDKLRQACWKHAVGEGLSMQPPRQAATLFP